MSCFRRFPILKIGSVKTAHHKATEIFLWVLFDREVLRLSPGRVLTVELLFLGRDGWGIHNSSQ